MFNLNKVMLIGRVGQDPKVDRKEKLTICQFSIATSESYFDKKTDSWKEIVTWHRCVAFAGIAGACEKHLTKGKLVYLEGKIRHNKYTDKQGVERTSQDIIVDNLIFLDGAKKTERDQAAEECERPQAKHDEILDDDIPF